MRLPHLVRGLDVALVSGLVIAAIGCGSGTQPPTPAELDARGAIRDGIREAQKNLSKRAGARPGVGAPGKGQAASKPRS